MMNKTEEYIFQMQFDEQRGSRLPWQQNTFTRKWAIKPSQTVNSPEYKQLRDYIHKPYRKIDNNGTKCYYFPTYVIFKIKNITEFDFQSLSAHINGVLLIKLGVDYQDKFSPNPDQNDQQSVRDALENLFKFQYKNAEKNVQKKDSKIMSKISFGETMVNFNNLEKKQSEEQIQEIGLKKYLYIQFNRDDPLRLPSKRVFEGQIKQEQKSRNDQVFLIEWTIRKQFTIALSPGSIWEDLIAPFNLLNFKLSLIFQDIDIPLKSKEGIEHVKFKFNCMKRVGNNTTEEKRRIFQQLLFTDDGSLGQYDLAQTGLNVDCQKYLSKDVVQDISAQYRSFKVITFNIPFYKYPIMDALTIFIPLVLITILTLFTFVQGPNFNDKIANIATLMIVYVGLMPVINDSLPPTTKITLIDIVLYFQLTISVLCLIRGKQIKDFTSTEFNNYRVWQDGYFRASVAIAAGTGAILILLLVYYCIMKSFFYNLQESDISQSDRKLVHWVSPHMHQQARNFKTSVEKIEEERKMGLSKSKFSVKDVNDSPQRVESRIKEEK